MASHFVVVAVFRVSENNVGSNTLGLVSQEILFRILQKLKDEE